MISWVAMASILGVCGTLFGIYKGIHDMQKTTKDNIACQTEHNTSVDENLGFIKNNQLKLTETLENVVKDQARTVTDVKVLEEKLKGTNLRIDNVEKEMKRK